MALSVDGQDVMTMGDFTALMRECDPSDEVPAVITAWYLGEPIGAVELIVAFDVGLRLSVRTERGHEMIDRVLDRLHAIRGDGARPRSAEHQDDPDFPGVSWDDAV